MRNPGPTTDTVLVLYVAYGCNQDFQKLYRSVFSPCPGECSATTCVRKGRNGHVCLTGAKRQVRHSTPCDVQVRMLTPIPKAHIGSVLPRIVPEIGSVLKEGGQLVQRVMLHAASKSRAWGASSLHVAAPAGRPQRPPPPLTHTQRRRRRGRKRAPGPPAGLGYHLNQARL